MSANTHVVNRTAVNEGTLSLLAATALISASSLVAADITYVHKPADDSLATATFEAVPVQTHQVATDGFSDASLFLDPVAFKLSTANLSGLGTEFFAQVSPVGIGALINCQGSQSATLNHKYPSFANAQANSTLTVDDGLLSRTRVVLASNPVDMYAEALMGPDFMYQANGTAFYVHYASWVEPGLAQLDFDNNEIRLFADGWLAFGGVEVEFDPTYVHQSTGANMQANMDFRVNVFTANFDEPTLAGTATVEAVGSFFAEGRAEVLADSDIITPRMFQSHAAEVDAQTAGEFSSDFFVLVSADYQVIEPTSEFIQTQEADVTRFVASDMLGQGIGTPEAYKWRTRWGEADFFGVSTINADADILGIDVDTIERPADDKEFFHPEEEKVFIRTLQR